MKEGTLIAKQALKIAELEEELAMHKEAADNIYNIIYCIGGPLNDNKLRYTHKQKAAFAHIASEIDF